MSQQPQMGSNWCCTDGVRGADRRRQLSLTEDRARSSAPRKVWRKTFNAGVVRSQMLGLVDLAHPAAAEQPADPIRPQTCPSTRRGRTRAR